MACSQKNIVFVMQYALNLVMDFTDNNNQTISNR